MAQKLASGYVELTADDKKARKAVLDLFKDADRSAAKSGKSSGDAFARQFKAASKVSPDLRDAGASAGRAGREAGDAFSRQFKQSSKVDADFSRTMRSTVGGVGNIGLSAGRLFGTSFLGALSALGIANSVQAIFQTAADTAKDIFQTGLGFEKVMNSIQGVTGSTVAQMNQIRSTARALGSDVNLAGTSASDAAQAILELVKGGLSLSDAMAAARGTLQLATAAQISSGDAATYVANALSMWQRPGSDAVHVADMLANAANASTGEASDYALALAQAGNVAAGFGISMEDTITSLALFAKFGIKGSDAGTLMKTSLQAITDQGNPAQDAIAELNLQLYDAQGNFVGYPEMLRQVAAASEHMSQEQFQAATSVLFGSDAMRASMVAANGGSKAFADMYGKVTAVGGAARMAGAQMQGLPGVMESISNTAEGLKLELFDLVDKGLQNAGGGFSNVLQGWLDWLKTHRPEVAKFFQAVADGAFTAADAMLSFTTVSLNGMASLLEGFNTAFPKMFEGFAQFGSVLKYVPGFYDMGTAMEKLSASINDGIVKGPEALRGIASNVEGLRGPLSTARGEVDTFFEGLVSAEERARALTQRLNEGANAVAGLSSAAQGLTGTAIDIPVNVYNAATGAPFNPADLFGGSFNVPVTQGTQGTGGAVGGGQGGGSVFGKAGLNQSEATPTGGGGEAFHGLKSANSITDFDPNHQNGGGGGNTVGLPSWGTPGQKFGAPPANWWLKPLNPDDVLFPEWMPPGQRKQWLEQWGTQGKRIQGLSYDTGGWLQDGYTLVQNKTGKPELVLNPDQQGKLGAALGSSGIDPSQIAPHMGGLQGGEQAILQANMKQGAGAVAKPADASAAMTDPNRTQGYIPASAGSSSVSGKSSISQFYHVGADIINSLIDQGGQAAMAAIGAAVSGGAAAGTMGAGAAAGPAASAAASFGIGVGTAAAKTGVNYGANLLSIWTDAGLEQLMPFGMPYWLTHDYTGFMPRFELSPAATTSLEQAQQAIGQGMSGGNGQNPGALPQSKSEFDSLNAFIAQGAKLAAPESAAQPPMFNISGPVTVSDPAQLGKALTKQAQLNVMQYANRPG